MRLAGLPGCTLSLRRRDYPFFAAKLGYISLPSKVAAGSAAAGTSSAEASETSAATIVVAIAATASPSAAAHDVCQEEEDQADVAGLDEEEEYQQDSRAAEHNLGEAKMDRLLLGLTVILMDRQGESDASVGGDDLGDLRTPSGMAVL